MSFVNELANPHLTMNVKREKLPETILEEFDGSTRYSITKGIFYIPDLHSKHLAYKVEKHIKYDKPIIEFCWDKIKAEIVLKDLMKA